MNEIQLSIPSSFQIGSLNITFYGVIVAVAYIFAMIICLKFAKQRGFSSEDIWTLLIYVVPLFIIFARAYYVIANLNSFDSFWEMLKFWSGGVAFYGGLFGGAIGAVIFCVVHKKNIFALADILAPALILAQCLTRWGNFFNQEVYGYAVTDPSWQFFPFAVYIDECNMALCDCVGYGWHYATFFYESLWNLIGFVLLLLLLFKVKFRGCGMVGATYLVFYGLGRAIIEPLRSDSLLWGNVRISFVVSILIFIAGLAYMVYYFIKHRRKKDSFDLIMNVLKKDL